MHPVNNPINSSRWSPIADYALLLGSGAGAIASIATQNAAAAATVPMTALVAMGLLNRRRIDRYLKQTDENLATLEGQMVTEVSILSEQVSALPSPEAINQLQRSALEHSDRVMVQFSEILGQTRQEFQQRIEEIESPDLSHLYQETAQLQSQFSSVSKALSNLNQQLERLAQQPRMEAAEAEVTHLKTEIMQLRVSLESLNSESKTAQSSLQDAISHLDRRLRQVPTNADPNLLKSEVRELIKAISDLVPRREFAALAEKISATQSEQDNLRETLERLRTTQDVAAQNGYVATSPLNEEVQSLKAELLDLAENLQQQVETRLAAISAPTDIASEVQKTTATHFSGLQWQLFQLEQQTQDLVQRQRELTAAPADSTPAASLPANAAHTSPQWLMALRGDRPATADSKIDQALFQALNQVSQRLVLVWPWSAAVELDERLIKQFTDILERGCRLEIGWCHPGDRHEGRLLKSITQQWQLTTEQRQLLRSTLNQLLPLKHQYPDHFSFKILGTQEQFLVCDRRYAIVSLKSLPAASSTFPELDLRVQTADTDVIAQLLDRFDNPNALPEDATAYFNRAITRYDLQDPAGAIADYAQVLRLNPSDAVTLNNRALIWVERKHYQRALEDFDLALHIDPYQFAARCNRGWLLMKQGQAELAIVDFDQAIQAELSSPIPYFYRGMARQRLGDSLGAITDFTRAIQLNGQVALLYCYRGAVYQRQGDITRAVYDLEFAAELLQAQGNHRSLTQVNQVLASLRQQTGSTQPVELRSA